MRRYTCTLPLSIRLATNIFVYYDVDAVIQYNDAVSLLRLLLKTLLLYISSASYINNKNGRQRSLFKRRTFNSKLVIMSNIFQNDYVAFYFRRSSTTTSTTWIINQSRIIGWCNSIHCTMKSRCFMIQYIQELRSVLNHGYSLRYFFSSLFLLLLIHSFDKKIVEKKNAVKQPRINCLFAKMGRHELMRVPFQCNWNSNIFVTIECHRPQFMFTSRQMHFQTKTFFFHSQTVI